MYVRNLSGTEYILQATATWQSEIDGNRTMSLAVLPTKANNVFIADIAEMWVITDDDDIAHKVVYAKRQGVGDMLTVDIKAVPLFFDDFDNLRIYEEYNRHMTAQAAFLLIFADTDYNFVLHDTYDAVDWEGFGAGETRLETFKRALNRYGAEFEISGNTIHLKALIGRDTQFQYRHRLNASNIVQEIDASGFWTYAKGYGDFGDGEGGGDWQDAKLIREYTSPLAQIPSIGIRHAPPIKDGRFKVVSAMDKALKSHVDNSLKVSVTTDIHDLRKQGYALAQPQLGDRVFLTDERIGFDEEVRVVAMSITKDWRGDVTHFSITIGDEGVTKRHMANMNTAIDNITNIVNGTQKLPNSVLDNALIQATKAIQNAQTELVFPESGGIWGIDKVDPNFVTGFTSRGFMVSSDGGATSEVAITGKGINTKLLIAGVINTNIITIGNNKVQVDKNGLFVYAGNVLGASLVEGYMSFNDHTNGAKIGMFSATVWSDNVTKGISMNMEANRYISFGHYTGAGTGYTPMVVMNPGTAMAGVPRGLVVNLPYRANDDIWVGPNALRFGLNNNHNHAAIYKSSGEDLIVASYQSVGLAHITSGGVANTKLSIHPSEVKINVDATFHGLNIRSYSDLWMGAKTLRFGDNPNHNHATVGLTSGRDLRLASYSGIGLAHITSGGVYQTKFSVDSNVSHSWQDLDMHGWRILRAASLEAESFVSVSDSSTFVGKSSSLMTRPEEDEATEYLKSLELARYTDVAQPKFLALNDGPSGVNEEQSTDLNEVLMYVVKSIQEIDVRLSKKEGVA